MAACSPQSEFLSLPKTTQKSRRSGASISDRSDNTDLSGDSSDKSNGPGNDIKKAPRRRACKSKVRTGCITCKARHVKCDEGKPSCGVCERLNLRCEGYLPPKVKKAVLRAERQLLPRPKETQLALLQPQPANALAMATPQSLHVPQVIPRFTPWINAGMFDDDDSYYFGLFRNQIVHELSPYHGNSFWTQTLLRDSTVHQCIRHSILSIGAYARAIIELRQERPWDQSASHPWRSPSPYNRHLQAALEHNTKALQSLCSHTQIHGVDNRLTMAATLLFIVFQNMQGNFHSSGDLIRQGIKIIKIMRSSSLKQPHSKPAPHRYLGAFSQSDQSVDEMSEIFARHSLSYVFVPFHHSKFAYHLLLTEDSDDEESDDEEESEDGVKPFEQPAKSIFLNSEYAWPRTVEQAQKRWDYLLPVLASFQSKIMWRNLNPAMTSDNMAILNEQAGLLTELRNYGTALESLAAILLCSNGSMSSYDSRALEFLQLQHTMAIVFTTCCTDPFEMAYDAFLHDFEVVVQRAEVLAASSPHNLAPTKVGFTNEASGLLQLLAFVGAKCRVQRVRQQAVDLLRQFDWREGIWDGISLAYAVEGVMQLEAQWLGTCPSSRNDSTASSLFDVPGTIPELSIQPSSYCTSPTPEMTTTTPLTPPPQARYAWTNMFWDFDRRHITFEYSRVMRDEFGEFHKAKWEMNETRDINDWTYFSSPSSS